MAFDRDSLANIAQEVGAITSQQNVLAMSALNFLHGDGDYAAYYFAGNDDTPLGAAKANFEQSFISAGALVGAPANNVIVHITDPMSDKGGRYKIATVKDYQGQRTHAQRPKNWQALRDWMHDGLPGTNLRVVNWTDREADDGAAFMAQADWDAGRRPGIYSRDKDWRIFGGNHVRWTDFELVVVPPGAFEVVDNEGNVYGHKFFWLQMLQGDGADNIPGLERLVYTNSKGKLADKNCGEVCAAGVLAGVQDNAEAYARVAHEYEEFYGPGWEVKFAEQAMLLWMRNTSNAVDNYMQIIPADAHYMLGKANAFIKKRSAAI